MCYVCIAVYRLRRKVMALAYREAKRRGNENVDTGHLLLGLIEEGSGVAILVLKNLGVDLGDARRRSR